MAQYNNAAGRILSVLQKLQPHSQKSAHMKVYATAFGVANSWEALLRAIQDLHDEFDVLHAEIDQFKSNPAKYDLYTQRLPAVEKSIGSFVLQMPSGTCQCNIDPTAVVAMQFIAADLPQEEEAQESDLEAIRQIVSDLQREIENSETFTKTVREWLLDLVRMIRDSIDRYAARGGRGMRKQLAMLVGELALNYAIAEQVKEEQPAIWQKLTRAIDTMTKLMYLAEHCLPVLDNAKKLLPWMQVLGLPAPGNDSPECNDL